MSGSVGKGKEESRSRVEIPDFLRPFVTQAAGTAGGALSSLQREIGRGDLVADFTPAQELAQALGIDRAMGGGDFFPTAQNTILEAARGEGIEGFLPEAGFDALTGAAEGEGLDFLSPEARETLTAATQGEGVGLDTLRGTAEGDFLFGGEGFDAAVDAAVRAARPQILSSFGRAGPSRATGGLAETAIGQSAIDAFARQFGQERQHQLGAAGALSDVSLGSARSLADLGSQERGRQLSSAGILSELGLAERGNQLDAASLLPELAEADIDLLDRIGATQQEMEQLRRMAPIDAKLQLLQAALTGLPISSFLGRDSEGTRRGFSFGFEQQ